MIEAFTSILKESAKEAGESINEIMPKFFDDIPKSDSTEQLDEPVLANRINSDKYEGTVYLITRNESLEGEVHPITGVPFERKHIEAPVNIEGVFPEFESQFDAQIPPELYEESDRKQFSECNNQLKDAIERDPKLEKAFDKNQLEQIENGDTPDGYVWHHDAEPGKIQLVDFETHANTGHTGGRTVWGGGNENR